MIRRYGRQFRLLLAIADALLATVLVIGLSQVRFGPEEMADWSHLASNPLVLVALYVFAWWVALWVHGLYRLRTRWTARSEAVGVLQAATTTALATVAVLFFLQIPGVNRLFLISLFVLQAVVTITSRALLRWVLLESRHRGRNLRNVVIVGTNREAVAFGRLLEERWQLGLRIEGVIGDTPPDLPLPWPYLGSTEELPRVLHERVVDEVAICLPMAAWDRVDVLARLCEDEGKIVRIPLQVSHRAVAVGRIEEVEGIPVLSLVTGPDRLFGLAIKRALDIAGSAIGLVLLSPVFVAVSVAILVKDGRPVFFHQQRAGLHGRPFSIVKFRTMERGADARRADLRSQNEVVGAAFKLTNDPRITPIGRFLRRTSIDELPQLWNVLRGSMSLVGPRPHPFDDVAGYADWHRRRLSMKPGITGLWQVGARSESNFDRWVSADLAYIDGWSLWLDIRVLLSTLPALVHPEGR